jgi:hypothetical protein
MPDVDMFASRLNSQLPKFVSWFPEPGSFRNDAFSFSWNLYEPYLFPPFILIGKVVNKIIEDKVPRVIMIIPFWKSQFWFPLIFDLLISVPIRLPRHKDLLTLPHCGTTHPFSRSMTLVAVELSTNICKVRVLPEVVSIILQSWKAGTRKQYSLAWGKWCVWCERYSKNPIKPTEIEVMSYLYSLHLCGKSDSVLNTHKSTLLQTLNIIGIKWCRSPRLISRFMRGIFNVKPSVPRYKFTWDVGKVLNLLSSWYPLDSLCIKKLTLKLTALIALACATRAQTLISLNLDYMKVFRKDKYAVFYFPGLLKTSTVGKGNNFCLKLEHFETESLCVYHTLLHYYINITKNVRQSRQLLISFVTHKAITSSTVARWLKSVLYFSGIDITLFKAHSFRSAAVSAAYSGKCSVKSILKTADWKSDCNFYKFYCRQSLNNEDVPFVKAIFSRK